MSPEAVEFRGQPALALSVPEAGRIVVALHGAQLLSWVTPDRVERLYLSPEAVFDGRAAIRGGVPICFPQFNVRGPLPKHGFVRNMAWAPEAGGDAQPSIVLSLRDSKATRTIWPAAFSTRLSVTLALRRLRVTLAVDNPGTEPWAFAAALHTYLRVDDIRQARLEGLPGAKRWDAVRDERHVEMAAALRFDAEFDSVYTAPAGPLRLAQPGSVLEIAQSPSCTETVVWNPGAALSAQLADLPDAGYRHMLCVEAACIDEPVLLAPGASWQGWQQLTVI